MTEIDELIAQGRTMATQVWGSHAEAFTDMADALVRLNAENARLIEELDNAAAVIDPVHFEKPSDAGDLSLAELIRRMREAESDALARLRAENERKDAALEPFAKAAEIKLCGEWADHRVIGSTDLAWRITFGDLRKAAAALSTAPTPAESGETRADGWREIESDPPPHSEPLLIGKRNADGTWFWDKACLMFASLDASERTWIDPDTEKWEPSCDAPTHWRYPLPSPPAEEPRNG